MRTERPPKDAASPELRRLCARHGGTILIQSGHDPDRPQKPPRAYWLIYDHPSRHDANVIRNAARIENSWGMTLSLAEDAGYRRVLDAFSLTYVFRGRGFCLAGNARYAVKTGDLLLLAPGVPHAYGPPPGERWDELSVFFSGPVFEPWRGKGLLDPAMPVRPLQPPAYWLERIQEVLVALAAGGPEQTPRDWGRLIELLSEMLSAWQRPATGTEADWLERARHGLAASAGETGQSWDRLARSLGVSGRTFRRRFKALTGVTPGQFRSRLRIEQACRRLLESDAKVAETALALGFANEFHFSRRFKQVMGLSPGAYRELHRNR
jgi:AraC-like DNA-binding protein